MALSSVKRDIRKTHTHWEGEWQGTLPLPENLDQEEKNHHEKLIVWAMSKWILILHILGDTRSIKTRNRQKKKLIPGTCISKCKFKTLCGKYFRISLSFSFSLFPPLSIKNYTNYLKPLLRKRRGLNHQSSCPLPSQMQQLPPLLPLPPKAALYLGARSCFAAAVIITRRPLQWVIISKYVHTHSLVYPNSCPSPLSSLRWRRM